MVFSLLVCLLGFLLVPPLPFTLFLNFIPFHLFLIPLEKGGEKCWEGKKIERKTSKIKNVCLKTS